MWLRRFHNLDKLIHYINYNASKGGPVVAFYSTPTHYTDMKYAASKKESVTWEGESLAFLKSRPCALVHDTLENSRVALVHNTLDKFLGPGEN